MAGNSGVEKNAAGRAKTGREKRATVRSVAGVVLIIVAAVWGIWLAHRRGPFALLGAKLQALPQSPWWDWWVGGLFGFLGLLGVLILWKVPQWQVARVEGLDSEKRFDKRNEARKTLATILGGVAFLTGGYFTWQNLNVAREGQITDRFTKATEQLAATDSSGTGPKLGVRIGGIYSLEAIAKESKEFHWPIIEMLSTYVRVESPSRKGTIHREACAYRMEEIGG